MLHTFIAQRVSAGEPFSTLPESQVAMSSHVQRLLSATLVVCALLVTGCDLANEAVVNEGLGDQSFVRVAKSGLTTTAPADGYTTANNENFYLAINKSQLAQKWFLSGYLTQWHPAEAGHAARSLGTRVVSFKIQNGKLFVFDATDGNKWSDTLDPQLVVEAYPIVTTYAPFNALPGSSNFVLIDPSAGLNRFEMMGDTFAASYQVRFEVELSYLQKFKQLADGIQYEQVFTGYSEAAGPGILGWDQPFRGSGTMSISLRRYAEGAGFVSQPLTSKNYFGSSIQQVPNQAGQKQNAVKWNIKPGMTPIPWRVSQAIATIKADPRFAGIDVEGAIARGVTGWNNAFGFPVFTMVPTGVNDSFGDDDKNFIVVDPNPGLGLAFANWRENPNTGEIRGASVYFSSVFLEGALQSAVDADGGQPVVVDAGTEVVDAGARVVDAGLPTCAPSLVISQVFGGNGNTFNNFRNQDYVELHNRSDGPVILNGLSLQYGSATAWQVMALNGTIPAGGYFLVGFAASGATADGGTAPGISPNQVTGINLSSSGGKVALVSGTTALTGACALGTTVIDFIGYGASNCSEARPVAASGTVLPLVRADTVACVDTNDNANDFMAANVAPRNASSAPTFCGCTNAVPMLPVFLPQGATVGDGGVNLTPPTALAQPSFRWAAMPEQHLCAMEARRDAVIPAGMTRKEFIEKYITEVVLHEIGHTLGLRHNFKGSLEGGTSVMDYNTEADALKFNDNPGPYDVAAVRFLYGLSTEKPKQAFCTDEDTLIDASCDRFDVGTNPLVDLGARFQTKVRKAISGKRDLQTQDAWPLTRYIRAPSSEAQRLEAFNLLIADTAPPLKPEIVALTPSAWAYADFYNASLLVNLFASPVAYRDPIGAAPLMNNVAFRSRVVEVARNSLKSSDNYRTGLTMRSMVTVLKEVQQTDAYLALGDARAHFASIRANQTPEKQAVIDDLIRRIDLATSPYFY